MCIIRKIYLRCKAGKGIILGKIEFQERIIGNFKSIIYLLILSLHVLNKNNRHNVYVIYTAVCST